MKYWQHERPLKCPLGTPMLWLGGRFWFCGADCCGQVWVARTDDPKSLQPGTPG